MGILLAVMASRPSPQARLAETVNSITAQLDVLRLSHYTPGVVQGGEILAPGEYQAALQVLNRVRREWRDVRHLVPDADARRVSSALDRLEALVRARAEPAEVSTAVEELVSLLEGLRARD